MARFLAMTSRGLADVLEDEIRQLGLKIVQKDSMSVTFESNWAGCYRANLCLTTATRIIMPVLDFPAYQPEDIYHNTQKHDFTKYISPEQTLAIDASVRDSSFKDRRFVGLKIKDAIVDQFRDKYSIRPDVAKDEPDLKVFVRVVKNQVSLSVDTSGQSLAFRGYRQTAGKAPLREHLAAGLLHLAQWDRQTPIVDLMCGSGTILIEAAMMARQISPGTLRKRFGFQRLKNFQPEAFNEIVDQLLSAELPHLPFKFYGFDISGGAISAAKENSETAGVEDEIIFKRCPVQTVEPPPGITKGLIIINPPYGERLGVTEELKDVYRDLAHTLKNRFQGWTCWLLSGNEELTRAFNLKATRRIPVFNGNIECRFLEYVIR